MSKPGELRGFLGPTGDAPTWTSATSHFPNPGSPRFPSKEAALKFMIEYNTNNVGSNPADGSLKHIFTMLTSWKQIEVLLLPAIQRVRDDDVTGNENNNTNTNTRPPHAEKTHENVFKTEETSSLIDDIKFRLNSPFHSTTTPTSTTNTLSYLYNHMKCGLFVMIKNNQLRIFSPFVNQNYTNTWGDKIKLEGDDTIDSYYGSKDGLARPEDIEKDRSKWWANGNIICNEPVMPGKENQFWGDHFLPQLRDMLLEVCKYRKVKDCEFFINKRDYPQLKVNVPKVDKPEQGSVPIPIQGSLPEEYYLPHRARLVEPYGFIYDKDDRKPEQDVELHSSHKYKTLAPIVSFYAASKARFADIPFPSSEDWEGACGEVFPHTFIHSIGDGGEVKFDSNPRDLFTESNFRKFDRSWSQKVNTAFFRGTATGGGVTIKSNQRLMVAHLSSDWKKDEIKGGSVPYCDAAIVGWNMRDKKTHDSPMTFLRSKTFAFDAGKHHFTPIYEQSKYKYLMYVDGHCAACRFGFMMRLGSVILKVTSRQVADTMWYFPLLKEFVHYVPVKDDLSDLEAQIKWCRDHDEECKKIADNTKRFYEKYVARNGLLDYVQEVCNLIGDHFIKPPTWYKPPPSAVERPKLSRPMNKCYNDKHNHNDDGNDKLCARCEEARIFEAKERERVKEVKAKVLEDQKANAGGLRKRAQKMYEQKMYEEGQAKKKQKMN